MAINEFNSSGCTLKSETKIAAFVEGIVLLTRKEQLYNRNNPTTPRNAVQGTLTIETDTFTGTLALPVNQELLPNGKVNYIGSNYLGVYDTFEAGTGDLSEAQNLVDGLIILGSQIAYAERLINPNVVLQTPNTVTNSLDLENNILTMSFNLPLSLKTDAVSGEVSADVLDFLTYAVA